MRHRQRGDLGAVLADRRLLLDGEITQHGGDDIDVFDPDRTGQQHVPESGEHTQRRARVRGPSRTRGGCADAAGCDRLVGHRDRVTADRPTQPHRPARHAERRTAGRSDATSPTTAVMSGAIASRSSIVAVRRHEQHRRRIRATQTSTSIGSRCRRASSTDMPSPPSCAATGHVRPARGGRSGALGGRRVRAATYPVERMFATPEGKTVPICRSSPTRQPYERRVRGLPHPMRPRTRGTECPSATLPNGNCTEGRHAPHPLRQRAT